jgi:Fe-S-cluster containining protein
VDFDCRSCGACCANPDENRAERVIDWVEVRDGEPLLDDAKLVARLIVTNVDGERHLRLDPEQRCQALRGRMGRHVTCTIYGLRPLGCRLIEPGDERCRQYRRERGIDR